MRCALWLCGPAGLAGSRVLPGLARARLAPFCRPRGAAEAGEGCRDALAATLIHPCRDTGPGRAGDAFLGSPRSSGRKRPAPQAGPQRSSPGRSARPGAQALRSCASTRRGSFRASGSSCRDARGAGQIARRENLPGGGSQLVSRGPPLVSPRRVGSSRRRSHRPTRKPRRRGRSAVRVRAGTSPPPAAQLPRRVPSLRQAM